jgi:polar amino acid transport system substrate-binding protein
MGRLTTSLCHVRSTLLPLLCLAFAASLPGMAKAAASNTLAVYFPEAPPLSVSGPDGANGIVGDVAIKAIKRAGFTPKLIALPWNRAQRTVQKGDDLLIIPLSRTPDREAEYTWIAPVMTMDRAFFSLDKRVDSFEQARDTYRRVAVGMGSAQEQKLREEGFSKEQIYPLKIGDNPAQLLLLGRVDAWFNGVPESRYIWPDVSSKALLESPPLMTSDLYLACSKRCDPALVEDLRKAVDSLRADGTIARIVRGYVDRPAH